MRHALPTLLISLFPSLAFAQDEGAPETLAFGGETWRIEAQEARAETHKGREALMMKGGRLRLDDVIFTDGVIEFDAAYDEVQGFIGPMWRAESDSRFEEIYVRSHLNEKPDAVQYTPVENGNSAWQIFSDKNAIAAVSQTYDGWNHVKVVVKGDRADFYFNSDAPVLHVPDLKTDLKSGYAGLRVSGAVAVHFSNIVFRPLKEGEKIVGQQAAGDAPVVLEGVRLQIDHRVCTRCRRRAASTPSARSVPTGRRRASANATRTTCGATAPPRAARAPSSRMNPTESWMAT